MIINTSPRWACEYEFMEHRSFPHKDNRDRADVRTGSALRNRRRGDALRDALAVLP